MVYLGVQYKDSWRNAMVSWETRSSYCECIDLYIIVYFDLRMLTRMQRNAFMYTDHKDDIHLYLIYSLQVHEYHIVQYNILFVPLHRVTFRLIYKTTLGHTLITIQNNMQHLIYQSKCSFFQTFQTFTTLTSDLLHLQYIVFQEFYVKRSKKNLCPDTKVHSHNKYYIVL